MFKYNMISFDSASVSVFMELAVVNKFDTVSVVKSSALNCFFFLFEF